MNEVQRLLRVVSWSLIVFVAESLPVQLWAAERGTSLQCEQPDSQHADELAKIENMCKGSGVVATALLEGGVLFKANSSGLSAKGEAAVAKLIADLSGFMEILSIKVIGHTDTSGSEQYNQLLSERRAAFIAAFFKNAFPQKKVTSVGLGESLPIADNRTLNGRKINRRVEIQIVANQIR